jgi:hypothetical protein
MLAADQLGLLAFVESNLGSLKDEVGLEAGRAVPGISFQARVPAKPGESLSIKARLGPKPDFLIGPAQAFCLYIISSSESGFQPET